MNNTSSQKTNLTITPNWIVELLCGEITGKSKILFIIIFIIIILILIPIVPFVFITYYAFYGPYGIIPLIKSFNKKI